jgi:hypothetical protein
MLTELKGARADPRLIEFQGLLAETIFRLSEEYVAISAERGVLVRRKDELDRTWFVKKLRALASYQTVLEETVAIGKSLGDSFAWFFYQNDPRLLDEHLANPLNPIMPSGVGGMSELEIAKGVHHVDGKFVVHHCVTSILRIGDVSLVQHDPLRVISIGEIKSGQPTGTSVDVEIIFRAPLSDGAPSNSANDQPTTLHPSVLTGLNSKARHRTDRQLRRITDAFTTARKPSEGASLQLAQTHYWTELASEFQSARARRFTYARVGGGLMVAIYKYSSRSSLYGRLAGKRQPSPEMIDDALTRTAQTLVVPSSRYNAFLTGTLHYSYEGWPVQPSGALPLFWWELPVSVTRAILLREAVVLSIFNPAHLLELLVQQGFSVHSFEEPNNFKLRIQRAERELTLGNARYWFGLIGGSLFREEQVAQLILKLVDDFFNRPPSLSRRTNIMVVHSLTPPTDSDDL